MSAAKARQPGTKKTKPKNNITARILEQCAGALTLYGFKRYRLYSEYQRALKQTPDDIPARRVIGHYPHETLYGTEGWKDAYIVTPDESPYFVSNVDGTTEVLVEVKHQNGSGSVTEKMPYIWMACLKSPLVNHIVVFHGEWWKDGVGRAALRWLAARPIPSDRRLYVCDGEQEFFELATRAWGAKAA